MALTEFGKAIRKARIDANETLLSMAKALGTSPAFLSGMETGRKKVPMEWVEKITAFFKSKSIELTDLKELAQASNETIHVEGLPLKQQMLLAGFAKSAMTAEQLKKLAVFLEEVNQQRGNR